MILHLMYHQLASMLAKVCTIWPPTVPSKTIKFDSIESVANLRTSVSSVISLYEGCEYSSLIQQCCAVLLEGTLGMDSCDTPSGMLTDGIVGLMMFSLWPKIGPAFSDCKCCSDDHLASSKHGLFLYFSLLDSFSAHGQTCCT